jgi:hypothetical protein
MGNFFKHFRPGELGTTSYVAASPTRGTRGNWAKLLDVTVDDADAEALVVNIRAEYTIDQRTMSPDLATPIVGIPQGRQTTGYPLVGWLIWGVGGAHTEVEFDIAVGRLPSLLVSEGAINGTMDQQPMINFGSGLTIHISASHVSLYVRNDGNMSPLVNPGGDQIGDPLGIAKVQAFLGPGDTTRPNTLERTIWCAGGGVNP